ncbi:MAG: Na/Pi cotransporter family protein [Eubacteriales bacterium]|nr:Na/Pi cotransporter family protein [Eubacteriales bacterium]MDY3332802.1 Na/Pi cotransporter family protein [Gallibacter sp.]
MNQDVFQIVITLFGGLAVFIYGMNLMSDGLQKAAGDKMRNILSLLTANPIFGVMAGALVTAVLQSSSATTVMVIGFVSAGLMKLPQAISVIFGANIGTTITAQLIAFNIGDLAWIFVFVGFVMFFFLKKREMVEKIGQIMFGFGLLFVGINTMGATMKPLAHSDFFVHLMSNVSDIPILGVFVGTLMTVVVQSSSATIAVLQNLASTAGPDGMTSILGLEGAIPILFGDNIGTTITALLACIGGSINAKRTAVAHTLFNLCGTLIFIWWIPQIIDIVGFISPKGPEVEVISRQIANTHLLFNLTNTIIFIPFIWLLVKIVTKIIPGEDREVENSQPLYLDDNVLIQPAFATHLAVQELVRNAYFALDMVKNSRIAYRDKNSKMIQEVIDTDKNVNKLKDDIIEYLAKILTSESIDEYQKNKASALMHVASDIEHIGDYSKNIATLVQTRMKNDYHFTDEAKAQIEEFFDKIELMLQETIVALETGKRDVARKISELEDDMNMYEYNIRKDHMSRVSDNICSPATTVIFLDFIHNIERMGDSCKNIADIVLMRYDYTSYSRANENENIGLKA